MKTQLCRWYDIVSKEKRQYTYKYIPYDFDWKLYLFLHPDIAHACKTEREAKLQYENYDYDADAIPQHLLNV